MLARSSSLPLAAALALASCRAPAVDEPQAQARSRTVTVVQEPSATPTHDRAANLRLWTVGLEREQLEALRPQAGRPLFVRMSPAGLELVPCAETTSVHWHFEPELPVRQHFVWSGEELAANLRVGPHLNEREELEVALVPIGSYWLDPERKAQLRREACEQATHLVVAVRVGELEWSDDGPGCTIRPNETAPPPSCDSPWMVELLATEPLARPAPVCRGSTRWTGRYCKSAGVPGQERSPFCDASTYDLPVCDADWRGINDWTRDTPLALPPRLEPEDIEPVMSELAAALLACVPTNEEWSMRVVVEGVSGRVVELLVPAHFSEAAASCLVELLRLPAFPSFANERQAFHWPPLGSR